MDDAKKKQLLTVGLVIVIAIGAAFATMSATKVGDKEEVVGTLPTPEGGGRDAEGGAGKGDPGNGPPGTN